MLRCAPLQGSPSTRKKLKYLRVFPAKNAPEGALVVAFMLSAELVESSRSIRLAHKNLVPVRGRIFHCVMLVSGDSMARCDSANPRRSFQLCFLPTASVSVSSAINCCTFNIVTPNFAARDFNPNTALSREANTSALV